jgi:hypothetical protein
LVDHVPAASLTASDARGNEPAQTALLRDELYTFRIVRNPPTRKQMNVRRFTLAVQAAQSELDRAGRRGKPTDAYDTAAIVQSRNHIGTRHRPMRSMNHDHAGL